ncbi:MAG: signal peptidase I [Candidatus Dormibacteraceae bacterium]
MLTLVSDSFLTDEPAERDSSAGRRLPDEVLADADGIQSLLAVLLRGRPPVHIFPASLRAQPPAVRSSGAAAPLPAGIAEPVIAALRGPSHLTPVLASRLAAAALPRPQRLPGLLRGGALGAWIGRLAIAATAGALVTSVLMVAIPIVLPVQEFAVLSGSMTPTIPVGSLVVDTRVPPAQLKVGDVITFQPPGRPGVLETHRIHSLTPGPNGPVVRTKGDANPVPDAWSVTLTGSGWRTAFSVPGLGYLMVLAKSSLGRLLLIVVPALILGLLYLADLRPGTSRRAAPA